MNGLLNHPLTSISLLTKSSLYGFIFILQIHSSMIDKLDSSVKSMVYRNFEDGKTVDKLLVKVTLVTDREESYKFRNIDGVVKKNTSDINDFKKEIEIQSKLWNLSIKNLASICPAIVSTFLISLRNE